MLSKLLREYEVSKETSDSMVKKQKEELWIKYVCEIHDNKCRLNTITRLMVEEILEKIIKTKLPDIEDVVDEFVDEFVDDILEESESDSSEDAAIAEPASKEDVNETRTSWLGIPFRSFQRVGILMVNRVRRTLSPNTVVIVDRNREDREEYFPLV
jgi:hypothetical protein